MIAWTINAATEAASVDRVVVSTDDAEVARIAEEHGADVPFMRPAALSTDSASSEDVIAHALEMLGLDRDSDESFALLQPTSPLRTSQDIDDAAALLPGNDAVISVTALQHAAWLHTIDNGLLRPWKHNDPLHILNGAIYMTRAGRFLRDRNLAPARTAAYVMPADRSVDVDTELDLKLCDVLLSASPHGAKI